MEILTGVSGDGGSTVSATNYDVSVITRSLTGDLRCGAHSASTVLSSHLALVGVGDAVGAADWPEDSLTKLAVVGGFEDFYCGTFSLI